METKTKDLKRVLAEKIAVVETFGNTPCKTYNFRCRMLSQVMHDILIYNKATSGAELDRNVTFAELVKELAANTESPNVNRIVGAKLFDSIPEDPFSEDFYLATEAEYDLLLNYYKHLKDALSKANSKSAYKELFEGAEPERVNINVVDNMVEPEVQVNKPVDKVVGNEDARDDINRPEPMPRMVLEDESAIGTGRLGL